MCPTTDSEEGLLQRHLHGRVYVTMELLLMGRCFVECVLILLSPSYIFHKTAVVDPTRKRVQFPNRCFLVFRIPDDGQSPETQWLCHTPSSEPFRFYRTLFTGMNSFLKYATAACFSLPPPRAVNSASKYGHPSHEPWGRYPRLLPELFPKEYQVNPCTTKA
jgi:hypothetical protein